MSTSAIESVNKISIAASMSAGFAISGAIMATGSASLALFGLVSSIIPICLSGGISKKLDEVELLYSDRNSMTKAVIIIAKLVLIIFSMIGSYYLLTSIGIMVPISVPTFILGVGFSLIINEIISLISKSILKIKSPIDIYSEHPLGRIRFFAEMSKKNNLDKDIRSHILHALEGEIENFESNKEYEEISGYVSVQQVLDIAKKQTSQLHTPALNPFASITAEAEG